MPKARFPASSCSRRTAGAVASGHDAAAPTVGSDRGVGFGGVWAGLQPHHMVYGLYQAALLSVFPIASRWNRGHRYGRDGLVSRALAVVITFQFVCFGLLIFSGRIGAAPLPHHASDVEGAYCYEIYGWIWDKHRPDVPVDVELLDGDKYLMKFPANQ